jgi:hypothetical protein
MAGAGKKTFTAGEVLTASDVNTYLMEQSVMYFAGTAARSSAIPTPSTGMTTYIGATGTASIPQLEVYTGSAFQTPYGSTLLANVSFTATSGINIENVFSSRYDNYAIEYELTAVSGTPTVTFQLRTGSTTVSTNYAGTLQWTNGSTANVLSRATNAFYSFGQSAGDTSSIMLCSPFKARSTVYRCLSAQGSATGYETGVNSNATSYESLTVGNTAGGLNTGIIRIYGLRNS